MEAASRARAAARVSTRGGWGGVLLEARASPEEEKEEEGTGAWVGEETAAAWREEVVGFM